MSRLLCERSIYAYGIQKDQKEHDVLLGKSGNVTLTTPFRACIARDCKPAQVIWSNHDHHAITDVKNVIRGQGNHPIQRFLADDWLTNYIS